MGVRFQCPNGHKLHVKTELAGKRGICPECGVRFVVPSFSGGRVAVDTGGATPPVGVPLTPGGNEESGVRSQQSGIGSAAEAIPAPAVPSMAPPIASAPPATQAVEVPQSVVASEPVAWYVRPASGGQFGPASSEVFQQWIADGRVAADSWVWRTGWADWKAGSEALALVADRPPLDPAAAMAAALDGRAGVLPSAARGVAAAIETTTAEQRRLEIKRRKQRVRSISTLLALVALAMLMALVFVLAQ